VGVTVGRCSCRQERKTSAVGELTGWLWGVDRGDEETLRRECHSNTVRGMYLFLTAPAGGPTNPALHWRVLWSVRGREPLVELTKEQPAAQLGFCRSIFAFKRISFPESLATARSPHWLPDGRRSLGWWWIPMDFRCPAHAIALDGLGSPDVFGRMTSR